MPLIPVVVCPSQSFFLDSCIGRLASFILTYDLQVVLHAICVWIFCMVSSLILHDKFSCRLSCADFWFQHILFMTGHERGVGRAKKLCLAPRKMHTRTHVHFYDKFTMLIQSTIVKQFRVIYYLSPIQYQPRLHHKSSVKSDVMCKPSDYWNSKCKHHCSKEPPSTS